MGVHQKRQGWRPISRWLGHLPYGEAARSLIARGRPGIDDREDVCSPALAPEQQAHKVVGEGRQHAVAVAGHPRSTFGSADTVPQRHRRRGDRPASVTSLVPDLHSHLDSPRGQVSDPHELGLPISVDVCHDGGVGGSVDKNRARLVGNRRRCADSWRSERR